MHSFLYIRHFIKIKNRVAVCVCGGRAGTPSRGVVHAGCGAFVTFRYARCAFSTTYCRTLGQGSRPGRHNTKIKNRVAVCVCGGRAGTRTLDPLIKSQLLYQLSYAPGPVVILSSLLSFDLGDYSPFLAKCKGIYHFL